MFYSWLISIYSSLIYFSLKLQNMTLVKFSPLENLFCYLFAWPLRGCGVAKVNSPSQIKGVSSSANPNGDKKSFLIHWESFPALLPRVPASGVAALRLCLDSVEAQVYLPAPWQREGKAQKAPLLQLTWPGLFDNIWQGQDCTSDSMRWTNIKVLSLTAPHHLTHRASISYARVSLMISLCYGSDDIFQQECQ